MSAQESPTPKSDAHTYWLVECGSFTPRRYWTAHQDRANTWETDPAKAIRYATRDEAMRVVMMLPEECEACEHMDCGAPWPVLDKPAQIGATRFGVGVSWSTVIDRAQREYEYRTGQDPEAANLLASVAQSESGLSDPFSRLASLIADINIDRYGKPLVAALHLCNDLADEVALKQSANTPMMVGGFCTDREGCVADRDLLARAYALLWDGDGGTDGVDIATDIAATLKQPHTMILDRATKNATDSCIEPSHNTATKRG